jgi:hypothetical protein
VKLKVQWLLVQEKQVGDEGKVELAVLERETR